MHDTAAPVPEPEVPTRKGAKWGERLRYASVAAALALLSTGILIALVPPTRAGEGWFEQYAGGGWWVLVTVYAIAGAPFLETALMAAMLYGLRQFLPSAVAVVGTAAICTCFHRLGDGVNWWVFPGFVVFGSVYLARERPEHDDAFTVTAMTHAIANVVLTILAVLFGASR